MKGKNERENEERSRWKEVKEDFPKNVSRPSHPPDEFLSLALSSCVVVCCCCVSWCGVCAVCVVVRHWKKPPCVRSKRPRVYRHHAPMCFNMCAWCRHTRGRFESTHGDVLHGHTEVFSVPHQQHKHTPNTHQTHHDHQQHQHTTTTTIQSGEAPF